MKWLKDGVAKISQKGRSKAISGVVPQGSLSLNLPEKLNLRWSSSLHGHTFIVYKNKVKTEL
ncbi:MAG: hypothetical protein KAS94_14355 [Desulfobulbaceae bacterium]|nr:hypothetical protein [Desulfobulbaceae bacterium]